MDFSDTAMAAVNLAAVVAKRTGAGIQLVHVNDTYGETGKPGEERIKEEHARQALAGLLRKYQAKFPRLKFSSILKEGKVHEEIVNQAEAFADSMIIVSAAQHEHGWEDLFSDSTVFKMVTSSSKPVITLGEYKMPETIDRIVLPIDTTLESREKVPLTAQFAHNFGALVDVITVSTSGIREILNRLNEYAVQVCSYLDQLDIECRTARLVGDNITDMTLEYAKKVDADLISVMSEQKKSISNLLSGSYAHQMVRKSHIPVLFFPTRQIGTVSESFKTEGIKY